VNQNDISDEQAGAIFLGGLCCCLLGVVALVVLIIVLTRKKPQAQAQPPPMAQTPYSQPYQPPGGPYQPPGGPYQPPGSPYAPQPGPYTPPTQPGPYTPQPYGQATQPAAAQPGALHLAVLAVGLDFTTRELVASQLAAPIAATNAFDLRVMLVQRVANVLLQTESAWRYFGYGEKALPDLGAAEQSYRANVEDFRLRSNIAAEPLGTVTVLTVVLATRAPLQGITRLDDPGQLRAALQSWQRLDSSLLLGAEYLWAPPAGAISDEAMARRFPEMQRLPRL